MRFDADRGKRLVFSRTVQTGSEARPPILCNGYRGYFLGVKRPGREVDLSHSYSAEVKNEWRHASAPPICLQGVGRDNFPPFL